MIPSNYEIIFEERDAQHRASTRILEQFQRSVVMLSVLYALVTEIQALFSTIKDTKEAYTIYDGYGETLNVIGRIIGLDRVNTQPREFDLLTEDGNQIITEDGLSLGVVSLVDVELTDDEMKQWITFKVQKNHNKFSSIPELVAAYRTAVDSSVEFRTVGPMQADIIVDSDTDEALLPILFDNLGLPATLSFTVRKNLLLLTEDDNQLVTENGERIVVPTEVYSR